LSQGELAINVTDKKLYSKDSGGNVILIASSGGDVTGPASSTNLAIPTFSGTTGKLLLNNSGVTISSGVITGTGFTGALNGSLGATTPSTVVATSVGISTANAANALNITASTGTNSAYQTFTNTGNTFYVGTDSSTGAALGLGAYASGMYSSTKIVLQSGSASNSMTLDTSGNVGIGVTPSAWASVYKAIDVSSAASFTGTATGIQIWTNSADTTTGAKYKTTAAAGTYQIAGAAHTWYTAPSGTAGNAITFTQAMTLDASGNLLVGTTSNVADVRGNFLTSGTKNAIRAGNSAATGDVYCGFFEFSGQAPNNTTSQFITCNDTSATRLTVRGNGGIANFSANDVNLSDAREKTNIELAGSYLDKICAIPVRTFLYKDQTDTQLNLGVIAQEVEVVAPELVDVSGFGETPEDGIPLKAIYQTDLQYALMKCIQEQQALITSLTARLEVLEAK
jgi:hypothetical protein